MRLTERPDDLATRGAHLRELSDDSAPKLDYEQERRLAVALSRAGQNEQAAVHFNAAAVRILTAITVRRGDNCAACNC